MEEVLKLYVLYLAAQRLATKSFQAEHTVATQNRFVQRSSITGADAAET